MARTESQSPATGLGWHLSIAWVLGLFLAVYAGAVRSLVRDWLTYDVSFGLVIVAISAYMLHWARRHLLAPDARPRPSLAAGLPIVATGNLLFLVGRGSGTLLLQELSVLVTLFGLVWLLYGTAFMRAYWIPLCYLVFALPLPGEILGRLSIVLQVAAAKIAAPVLALSGMPVIRSGPVLELPHITLEVARVCNGSNHIVALMSLVVPLGFVSRLSLARKALVVLCALFLGIFLNGVRIALIGLWSVRSQDLHGPMSTLFTSFIFFVGLVVLSLFTLGLKRKQPVPLPAAPASGGAGGEGTVPLLAAAGLATALLAASGLLIAFHRPQPALPEAYPAPFTNAIGAWKGMDSSVSARFLGRQLPDIEVRKRYQSPSGQVVDLYIAYFALQTQDREVVSFRLDRLHANAEKVALSGAPGGSPTVNATTFLAEGKRTAGFFWYDVNGRILTSRHLAKLSTAADWLLRRRTNGAFVIIVPESEGRGLPGVSDEQREFVRLAMPAIREFLGT